MNPFDNMPTELEMKAMNEIATEYYKDADMNDEEYRKQLLRTIGIIDALRSLAAVMVMLSILGICFAGLIISIQNPELTQMQVIYMMLGIGN